MSKYEDTFCLRRIDQRNYQGWQFCLRKTGFKKSKFFSDSKYNGYDGAYKEAIDFRNEYFSSIEDHEDYNKQKFPIDFNMSKRNTSGILGVCRVITNRKGREQEITWRATYKNSKDTNAQKGFDIAKLGEINALKQAIIFRREYVEKVKQTQNPEGEYKEKIESYISDLKFIEEYLDGIDDTTDEASIFLGAINNNSIKSTTKESIVKSRIGQSQFRQLVLGYWNNQCAITGSPILLTASHIKPWKHSAPSERLDVYNGIALSPVYDKAFDSGLISFQDNGQILISSTFIDELTCLGVSKHLKINNLTRLHCNYLKWHRANIFKE